jgi:putative methyltransferase (TIGR04325 family)
MNFLKRLVKDWAPPLLLRAAKRLGVTGVTFKGKYSSWEIAAAQCSGYESDLILDKVLSASLKVKSGEAVFERDSIIFNEIQYSWPVTAALMWSAARNNGILNVLDFGGSLGSSYFQNKKFLSKLRSASWHVVEQPHFVKKGREHIEDNAVKFFSSIEESVNVVMPNVILLSSVTQYLPNPDWLFDQINNIEASILIFDRTPFHDQLENSLCIQCVPGEIYRASYPMWLLSRSSVFARLDNWRVHEKFTSPEGSVVSQSGMEFEFCGYIFERIYAK